MVRFARISREGERGAPLNRRSFSILWAVTSTVDGERANGAPIEIGYAARRRGSLSPQAQRSLSPVDAWNAVDAPAFAAPLTDEADFVAFEGTHLKGRREIGSFHREIFDTVVKEARLEGEVKFVRFLSAALAVMQFSA